VIEGGAGFLDPNVCEINRRAIVLEVGHAFRANAR
jgi:hypothetical protein